MEARTTLALSFLGLLLGIFISAGVLAGDEQGRVNLLFLLLLFAFLPLLSLLLGLEPGFCSRQHHRFYRIAIRD